MITSSELWNKHYFPDRGGYMRIGRIIKRNSFRDFRQLIKFSRGYRKYSGGSAQTCLKHARRIRRALEK